jgi:hypothetical protein
MSTAEGGSYSAPWLASPLGPFRNTRYRGRRLGAWTLIGVSLLVALAFFGLNGAAWIGGVVIFALALVLSVLLRRPSVSFTVPQSVTFRQNGIELRLDSPVGSVTREVAYFDVIPQPLKADGSLYFEARNTYATRWVDGAGRPFPARIGLRSADALKVSRAVPGFYPHQLVPVALWAKRAGLGLQASIQDAQTDPRAVLVLYQRGKGPVVVEVENEKIRASVRISFMTAPGAPNRFASFASKEREELGTFLKATAQALGQTTSRVVPEQVVDIAEMRFVELSRSLPVKREDPGSFQRLAETFEALDTDARRLVTKVSAQMNTVRQESTLPPDSLYG